MAEEKVAKSKPEVTKVSMEDGREVEFVGKRQIDKSYSIDEALTQVSEDGSILIAPGAIKIQVDFRNGKTLHYTPAGALIAQLAGHGAIQKLGDEVAGYKPDELDDAFLAMEELRDRLAGGQWSVQRESGGGFSGASVVIQAIVRAQAERGVTMTVEQVKDFLQKKLDSSKAAAEASGKPETALSRQKLYASFRNPKTRVGQIIKEIEEEKAAKESAVDADAALEEMAA